MTVPARPPGTRLRLHCQPAFLSGFEQPELVTLSPPAGSVGAGPADERIKVVDALDKALYDDHRGPPYRGPVNPPARPDPRGHFDWIASGTPEFIAAHAYAALRMVLDIWESYAGERVRWFFAEDHPRLEVIPSVDWENGQAGYGYIELGYGRGEGGAKEPFSLSFDVLAHEMGHILVASELGLPVDPDPTHYAGFQEAAADIIALVCALHFGRFQSHLLAATRGNLYVPNELNRLAELSPTAQIRSACHGYTMDDVDFSRWPARWLSQEQIHRLGQPYTGAVFDILVEVFHESLVERGAISRGLDDIARRDLSSPEEREAVQRDFDAAYQLAPDEFSAALRFARDFIGTRITRSWRRLDPDRLTMWSAAVDLLSADRELGGNRYQDIVRDCLRWRRFAP